jgi:hypothetical protein
LCSIRVTLSVSARRRPRHQGTKTSATPRSRTLCSHPSGIPCS